MEEVPQIVKLPPALLASILQLVPQQPRITRCAVVSTAWKAAAAQATVDVKHKLSQKAATIFTSWLTVYGSHLQFLKLDLCLVKQPVLKLPVGALGQLQHLVLQGCKLELQLPTNKLQLPATENHATRHQKPLLDNLRHLKLSAVQFADATSLLQLTNEAPNLSTLRLARMDVATAKYFTKDAQEQLADVMLVLLERLPELTVLSLDFPISEAALVATSVMQRLQQVMLYETGCIPLGNLNHLPSSVTELQLLGSGSSNRPGLPQELPQLSGLRYLAVSYCTMAPNVLSSLTQLQTLYLRLNSSQLLATAANPQSTAELLEALPELRSLQDARFILHGLDTVNVTPWHFAALTDSMCVKHLALSHDNQKAVPKGAAAHMFPDNRQMQSLLYLGISTKVSGHIDPTEWCLTGDDIRRISSSCPELRYLDISSSVKPGTDLSELKKLPQSCTSLVVGGAAFTDAAATLVGQLTQLRSLKWTWSPDFRDAGLEKLAGVELDRLVVSHCSLSAQTTARGTSDISTSDISTSDISPYSRCDPV